jgi:hypothetical protein
MSKQARVVALAIAAAALWFLVAVWQAPRAGAAIFIAIVLSVFGVGRWTKMQKGSE